VRFAIRDLVDMGCYPNPNRPGLGRIGTAAESSFVERFIGQIIHPETGWGRMWAEFHGGPAPGGERRQA
jgi:hypothetical protein